MVCKLAMLFENIWVSMKNVKLNNGSTRNENTLFELEHKVPCHVKWHNNMMVCWKQL